MHYEIRHRAGYGADDHMAQEIIARAARLLGEDTAQQVAAHVGLASHPVPTGSSVIRRPCLPGVRFQLEQAIRDAKAEVTRSDCAIVVDLIRETREELDAGDGWYDTQITIERKDGDAWVVESRHTEHSHLGIDGQWKHWTEPRR